MKKIISLLLFNIITVTILHAQNVGIGTTAPTQKLDVRGSTTDDGVLISVGNADGSHKLGLFGGRLNDPNPFIIWKDGDPLRFAIDFNGFSELMRIMPNGNIGIGTTTPTLAKLQVQGMVGNTVGMFSDIATSQGISLVANWPGIYFNSYFDNGIKSMSASGFSSFIENDQLSGFLSFNLSDVANTTANGLITVPERMRITGSGQVGIGTTAPAASAILDVSSTTQGFLPPRMEETQIEALTPVEGLQVYNTTTHKPNYYDGSQWRNMDGTIAFGIGVKCLGGVVAYILQPGDPGYDPNLMHGLIASLSDLGGGSGFEWGCSGTLIPGADGTALGTGNQNTIDIVAGCSTAGIAAELCADLTLNGYNDWYLPSLVENVKLYLNTSLIGGFTGVLYWSSSESSNTNAVSVDLVSGSVLSRAKSLTLRIRPIRSF